MASRRLRMRQGRRSLLYRGLGMEPLESRSMLDGQFGWAAGFGSGAGRDYGQAIATDPAGNVYVAGIFQGIVDFDPGPGTSRLGGESIAAVAKYTASGSLVWAQALGNRQTRGWDLAVDAGGNVFVTGSFFATTDFDFGPADYELTSFGSSDMFIVKLDASGTFEWARQFGGTGWDQGRSIAADSAGNVLATGYFAGTADFDPGPGVMDLTSGGSNDAFVVKLDSAGELAWVRQFGGTGRVEGGGIAVDNADNVYTTGLFNQTADFDPSPASALLTSVGLNDAFVSKLDSAGNFVYARQLGGASFVSGHAIAVDSTANAYVTGHFYETVDFDPGAGTANLTSFGKEDVFVLKLDSSGDYAYARQFGGSETDNGYGIAVDGSGNAFIAGRFGGTADFDPGPSTHNLTATATNNSFVAKLDTNGDLAFAGAFSGAELNTANAVAVDPAGNIYTTGLFHGTADFDLGPAEYSLAAVGNYSDAFVAKLDDGGNFLAAFALGVVRGGFAWTEGVAVHGGHVYVAGSFQGEVDFDPGAGEHFLTAVTNQLFVAKLTTDGGLVWVRQFGNSASGAAVDIGFDAAGNFYVAGMFQGTADFDPGPGVANLVNSGNSDVFLVKFDAEGNFIHARHFGGSANITLRDLAVDPQGNAYTTGYFSGNVDFDPGPGSTSLTSNNQDGFVSKIDSAGNLVYARKVGGSSNDRAHGIAADAAGNAYIVGYFFGTVDFDPGPGVLNFTSAGSADGFIWKLDAAGGLVAAWQLGGASNDLINAIAVDQSGGMYVTGRFAGTTDLDPGPSVSTFTSSGFDDVFVAKLGSTGDLLFAGQMGGPSWDEGTKIAVDDHGAIYLGGSFEATADLDPGSEIDNRTVVDYDDAYLVKLSADGSRVYAASYNATMAGLAPDSQGNVYAVGMFNLTVDFDPGSGEHNLVGLGSTDVFLTKLLNPAEVVGRHVFYNNSRFDADANASPADDAAIAHDKTALLPGASATATNYTNYSRGINGVVLDLVRTPGVSVELADFDFRVGNDHDPQSWAAAPAPAEIAVRQLPGGVQRVTLIWPDGAIANEWLRVALQATPNTSRTVDEVFYFGNQIGDVNGDGQTNASDYALVRSNPATFLDPAAVDNLFDLNRDGRVNAADLLIVRDNATPLGSGLSMLDLSEQARPATPRPEKALHVPMEPLSKPTAPSSEKAEPLFHEALPPLADDRLQGLLLPAALHKPRPLREIANGSAGASLADDWLEALVAEHMSRHA